MRNFVNASSKDAASPRVDPADWRDLLFFRPVAPNKRLTHLVWGCCVCRVCLIEGAFMAA